MSYVSRTYDTAADWGVLPSRTQAARREAGGHETLALRDYKPANKASLFVVLAIRLINHSIPELDGICCKPRLSV